MLIIFGEIPSIDKGFWTFQHFQHPLLLLLLPNIYSFLSTLRRGFCLSEALVLRKEQTRTIHYQKTSLLENPKVKTRDGTFLSYASKVDF